MICHADLLMFVGDDVRAAVLTAVKLTFPLHSPFPLYEVPPPPPSPTAGILCASSHCDQMALDGFEGAPQFCGVSRSCPPPRR